MHTAFACIKGLRFKATRFCAAGLWNTSTWVLEKLILVRWNVVLGPMGNIGTFIVRNSIRSLETENKHQTANYFLHIRRQEVEWAKLLLCFSEVLLGKKISILSTAMTIDWKGKCSYSSHWRAISLQKIYSYHFIKRYLVFEWFTWIQFLLPPKWEGSLLALASTLFKSKSLNMLAVTDEGPAMCLIAHNWYVIKLLSIASTIETLFPCVQILDTSLFSRKKLHI